MIVFIFVQQARKARADIRKTPTDMHAKDSFLCRKALTVKDPIRVMHGQMLLAQRTFKAALGAGALFYTEYLLDEASIGNRVKGQELLGL